MKIAIENHAGDMQARELKMLIEGGGQGLRRGLPRFGQSAVGDRGSAPDARNARPYVLTSHIRDTAVWGIPEGAAVQWVRMGEGNVGIDSYLRRIWSFVPVRR